MQSILNFFQRRARTLRHAPNLYLKYENVYTLEKLYYPQVGGKSGKETQCILVSFALAFMDFLNEGQGPKTAYNNIYFYPHITKFKLIGLIFNVGIISVSFK